MQKIFPLSEQIIAKIAAGEVIERPAYVVKELVENALDAGATTINITIEESGLKKISVIDNGEGMDETDILESFKPHTTSKINSEEQLSQIETLGFRGEALSSIAAISTVEIKSKTQSQDTGIVIKINEGIIETVSPVGMPQGTSVTVQNIFHSVPARKKFLKSQPTEYRHILEIITRLALAYPDVQFSLINNGKTIFDLPKTRDALERIKYFLGAKLFTNLLPVTYTDSYITISGFITKPNASITTQQKQFTFINQRKVQDKLTSQAVKDAYGTLIEHKNYPIFILFIDLPFQLVDVNVHPRKEEVRFADSKLLYDAIYKAVSESLQKYNLAVYETESYPLKLADEISPKELLPGHTDSFAGRLLKDTPLPWQLITEINATISDLVQIHKLYIVSQTKFGLQLIDQHAAHERILYEKLVKEFIKEKNKKEQYTFHKPKTLELTLTESEMLDEYSAYFTKVGFMIEKFKDTIYSIHAVPLLFQDRNSEILIKEMLNEITNEKISKAVDTISQKMIAYLACRGAIKAGDSLTKKQCKELLKELQNTPNHATCPHGRPVTVILDIERINKLFKRKK